MDALGIAAEVAALVAAQGAGELAEQMPDEWVDALSAAGTPEQVATAVQRWAAAGADSVVFQPLDGDPDCLDEYVRYLMPLLKPA
jgi:alkanesulfonate monooxygenase SsuD/methylene tetrahydromethanopterin reductase-like flavin-dependent oxidoreductase (luciferase family)